MTLEHSPAASAADLLGGLQEVKNTIVVFIKKARAEARLTQDAVDELCKLGRFYTKPQLPQSLVRRRSPHQLPESVPSISEVENDPSRLTSRVFSLVTSILPIRLDLVFAKALSEIPHAKKEKFKNDARGLGGKRSCGSQPASSVPLENQIDLLILMQVVHELDAQESEVTV